MGLIYLGGALVIGGAMTMLVSYHLHGPAGITDFGKILAFLGFLLYVLGRIRYRRMREANSQSDTPQTEEDS